MFKAVTISNYESHPTPAKRKPASQNPNIDKLVIPSATAGQSRDDHSPQWAHVNQTSPITTHLPPSTGALIHDDNLINSAADIARNAKPSASSASPQGSPAADSVSAARPVNATSLIHPRNQTSAPVSATSLIRSRKRHAPDSIVTEARAFLQKTFQFLEYAGDKFDDTTVITEFAEV